MIEIPENLLWMYDIQDDEILMPVLPDDYEPPEILLWMCCDED